MNKRQLLDTHNTTSINFNNHFIKNSIFHYFYSPQFAECFYQCKAYISINMHDACRHTCEFAVSMTINYHQWYVMVTHQVLIFILWFPSIGQPIVIVQNTFITITVRSMPPSPIMEIIGCTSNLHNTFKCYSCQNRLKNMFQ